MDAYPVRIESAAHFDHPVELVFAAARALLEARGARVVVADAPRHLRAERGDRFGSRGFDELWLEAWGEGTGVRYKGGVRPAAGRLGAMLLRGVVRRDADARARSLFDGLRAALGP